MAERQPTTCAGTSRPAGRWSRATWRALSVATIDRFRTLARRSSRGAAFERAVRGLADARRAALAAVGDPQRAGDPSRSVGRLVTETLPFDYSQFGSLPGVA